MPVLKKVATGVLALALAGIASVATASTTTAATTTAKSSSDLQEVLFVGNNWEGTVDVVSPRGDFARVGRINVIPDLSQRMWELVFDPVRLAYFLAIRALIGEGHDQWVDDMYTSPDGRLLVVSRPSLADVVGIRIDTGQLAWRFRVDGQRADHMALSPDGRRVAVSASTANIVHVLDIDTGREVGRFPSGDSPHENVYSRDGRQIFHASIGLVYTPLDHPWLDTAKGKRYFQVVDANTNEIIKRVDMRTKLDQAGYPNLSSAVRPMTLSVDERFVYFQLSFLHGFVEYDLQLERITRVAALPIADHAKNLPREKYVLDSAHHGIAMNPQGTKLCVAGTMSDYATIVSRETFAHGELVQGGLKPYWATSSSDGRYCFVSWAGSDRISVISYDTGEQVASVPVGDHPQRMRLGKVEASWLRALAIPK